MKDQAVIKSLIFGSLSSAFTTTIYQPLELLKTRIQLQGNQVISSSSNDDKVFGRTTLTAMRLVREQNFGYLWRGTGASLLRSVPGVGIYYASLNLLQANLSKQHQKPDNPTQAFYFGLTARSMVSFILLPITVIKVRYESGQYKYSNPFSAIKDSYLKSGWVGMAPTILRDSLFSGIYYMCYTKLKIIHHSNSTTSLHLDDNSDRLHNHSLIFLYGLISGLIASLLTNPIDVLKTKIQVDPGETKSMGRMAIKMFNSDRGYIRFFDGLAPRSLRRTLIAASTWTFYEFFMDALK